MPGTRLSSEEIRLAKQWYVEDEETPAIIAERLGRDKSTLTRLLIKRAPRTAPGRKPLLTEAQKDRLEKKLKSMILKADGAHEVTVEMLQKSSRCKASTKTITRALHERNVYFRSLREKPVLTETDIADRKKFADKYHSKPASWWSNHLHMSIDCKHFQVLLHGTARKHAAQQGARGAYRLPGDGLGKGYTKPSKKLKYNPGTAGVQVLAAVGNGKILAWEYIEGRWNGDTAAKMYTGPLLKKLKKNFPAALKYNVLEDNDPTGFKSSKGVAAKDEANIKTFWLPKRSPDLNVCDYWLWAEVNRRMRKAEQSFPAHKKESRKEFLSRLRSTALKIPTSLVRASVQDMRSRCKRMLAAEGGHIEEGGRSQ